MTQEQKPDTRTKSQRAFDEEIDHLRTEANSYIASGQTPDIGAKLTIGRLTRERDQAEKFVLWIAIFATIVTVAAVIGWVR